MSTPIPPAAAPGPTGAPRQAAAEPHWSLKTKIIATVGPACATFETLRELVTAGVDVFRLNFAHGSHTWLASVVGMIRRVSHELGRPVAILGDLSGPKIRLEEIPGGVITLVSGHELCFVRHADPAHPEWLTSTYEPLVDDLQENDRVLLADGTVSLRVVRKVPQEQRVVCRVEQGGELRSKQGINLPGVKLQVPSLTAKDRDDLFWALSQQLDFVSLSFVRSADDIRKLKELIAASGTPTPPFVVAKIEKVEAIDDLEAIVLATDVVMVARGDLGVEADLAAVPMFQKRIIRLCNTHRVPVITATQMLDSMQNNRRPTRAEASDVANAVIDGTDAVMLSGETAIGKYPAEVVSTMGRIAREAERFLNPARAVASWSPKPNVPANAVTEGVVHGAVVIAEHIQADLYVVATRGGLTAMALSQQRSRIPILGISDNAQTATRLCLVWGVHAEYCPHIAGDPQALVEYVVKKGKHEGFLKPGHKLVVISSSHWSAPGHDSLLVHVVT